MEVCGIVIEHKFKQLGWCPIMKTENLFFDLKGDRSRCNSISLLAPWDLNGSSVGTVFVPPLTIKLPESRGYDFIIFVSPVATSTVFV